jgi:hypothetical protein
MTTGKLLAMSLFGSASLIATAAIAETAADGGRKFSVTMTGAAERPGPGDPDGSGTAEFTINPGQRRLCYELEVTGIAAATAAHIHIAPVTDAGPVVVGLAAPSDGDSSGCVDITRDLALAIIRDPSAYYVNVHNADFPAGAVRAQLTK